MLYCCSLSNPKKHKHMSCASEVLLLHIPPKQWNRIRKISRLSCSLQHYSYSQYVKSTQVPMNEKIDIEIAFYTGEEYSTFKKSDILFFAICRCTWEIFTLCEINQIFTHAMLRLILFFGVMLDLSKLTEIVPLCSNRLGDARFVHTNAFKNQMINIECVFFFS